MTTDTPDPSPSLDEQCARAMGWKHMIPGRDWIMPEVLHWLRPDGSLKGSLPRFSTDPALLDAKLAWLAKRCRFHQVNMEVQESGSAGVSIDIPCEPFKQTFFEEYGDSIHEATARLVVAVAERLKERTDG